VENKSAELLAAGLLTDRFRGITQKIDTQENFFWVESGIPSFGRNIYRLLIKGTGEVNLIYDSLKGGYYTTKVRLQ